MAPVKRKQESSLKLTTEEEILKPTHYFKGSRELNYSKRPPSIVTANLFNDSTPKLQILDPEAALITPEMKSGEKIPTLETKSNKF